MIKNIFFTLSLLFLGFFAQENLAKDYGNVEVNGVAWVNYANIVNGAIYYPINLHNKNSHKAVRVTIDFASGRFVAHYHLEPNEKKTVFLIIPLTFDNVTETGRVLIDGQSQIEDNYLVIPRSSNSYYFGSGYYGGNYDVSTYQPFGVKVKHNFLMSSKLIEQWGGKGETIRRLDLEFRLDSPSYGIDFKLDLIKGGLSTVERGASWPKNWMAYSPFDAIILLNNEYEKLDREVRVALNNYVATGGKMVIYGWPKNMNEVLYPWQENDHFDELNQVDFNKFQIEFSALDRKKSSIANSIILTEQFLNLSKKCRCVNVGMGSYAFLPMDFLNADNKKYSSGIADYNYLGLVIAYMEGLDAQESWVLTEKSDEDEKLWFSPFFPKGVVVGLIICFSIVVGPLSFLLLGLRKKRIFLLVTTPIIAVITTLFLVSLIYLGEGTSGKGFFRDVIVLNELTKQAIHTEFSAYYFPIAPWKPKEIQLQTVFKVDQATQQRLAIESSDKLYLHHMFVPRMQTSMHSSSIEPTELRLEFLVEDQKMVVVNWFNKPIKRLSVCSEEITNTGKKKVWWEGKNLAPGERCVLTHCTKPATKQSRSLRVFDKAPNLLGTQLFNRERMTSKKKLDDLMDLWVTKPGFYSVILDEESSLKEYETSDMIPKYETLILGISADLCGQK